MPDPVDLWRGRAALSVAASSIVVAAAAMWAAQPISIPELPEVSYRVVEPGAKDGGGDRQTLDASVFEVDLWPVVADPVELTTELPDESPSSPSLDLELIGITTERGKRIAAVYDRGSDRLHLVANGEALLGRTVRIQEGSLSFHQDGRLIELALSEAPR